MIVVGTSTTTGDPGYVATAKERKLRGHYYAASSVAGITKVVVTVAELTTNDPTAVDDKGALVTTKLKSYTRVITVSKGL